MAVPIFGIASLLDYIQTLQRLRDTGLSEDDYNQQMGQMQTSMNTPEYMDRFENNVRDMNYGTVSPVDPFYVGPQAEDSVRFQLDQTMLPRRLDSLPVESTFTPEQLEAMRNSMYGTAPEVGPQREEPFVMPGPGGDYMPRDGGAFEMSPERAIEYLLGGGGGGGGGSHHQDTNYYAMARGGQISRGRR
jgi:hypothetical protein